MLAQRLQEPHIKLFNIPSPATQQEANLSSSKRSQIATSDNIQYLQASPEYAMKELMAQRFPGHIFQICQSFRQGEQGRIHNPEFTMLEWYRIGWSQQEIQKDILSLLDALLHEYKPPQQGGQNEQDAKKRQKQQAPEIPDTSFTINRLTYQQSFEQAGLPIPLHSCSYSKGYSKKVLRKNTEELREAAAHALATNKNGSVSSDIGNSNIKHLQRSQILDLLFGSLVAESLKSPPAEQADAKNKKLVANSQDQYNPCREYMCIVDEFPCEQAGFTTVTKNQAGEKVANRFELFWRGIEIANGGEEAAPDKIYTQLEGEAKVMMDENVRLVKDAWKGLPPCSGVAMGVDRVVMLLNSKDSLSFTMAPSHANANPTCYDKR